MNSTAPTDEAQIRQLIADQASAIAVKDVDRIMSQYAPDAIIYDVKPPFQTHGTSAWRRVWETCLPYFPATFRIEQRDLHLHVSGDLALAHWLFRFTDLPPNHPAGQTWIRITAAYQRRNSRWQILHEHTSVPFDPQTSQAAFTLEL